MPLVQSSAAVHTTTVLDRTELAPGVVVIGLHAPQLVAVTRPGHFVMMIPPSGERASVALGVYEAEGERASFMVLVCGPRTRELADVAPGETLDLFGPLGNGFDLERGMKNVAIVAGGVGIASVLLAARALDPERRAGSALLWRENERAARGCRKICASRLHRSLRHR